MSESIWLPVVFAGLMGLSILIYVILDGFDLGVGILFGRASEDERDRMMGAIGPFWDANETWLVLGIGLLLVAFPLANGIILTSLYLPTFLMLVGLIVRGVAFDFRAKTAPAHRQYWNFAFFGGSLLAALCQGYMLGAYIVGFEPTFGAFCFSCLTAICLVAGYAFVGATWLILKTDGEMQRHAVLWARATLGLTGLGMAVVSIATPLVSTRIFDKWFSTPQVFFLAPIPLITAAVFVGLTLLLFRDSHIEERQSCWIPFAGAAVMFLLGFIGLGYSFYPYVVIDRVTIWQAASAPSSLMFILVGALIVLPFILAYTIYAHYVFWGKSESVGYH